VGGWVGVAVAGFLSQRRKHIHTNPHPHTLTHTRSPTHAHPHPHTLTLMNKLLKHAEKESSVEIPITVCFLTHPHPQDRQIRPNPDVIRV
jgi:hypothetical protein